VIWIWSGSSKIHTSFFPKKISVSGMAEQATEDIYGFCFLGSREDDYEIALAELLPDDFEMWQLASF
jgi:hypothetical protein